LYFLSTVICKHSLRLRSVFPKKVYGSIKSIPVATNFACQEVPLKGGGKVTFLQDLFPLSEALDDQLWLTGVVKTMLKALFHWNDDARAIAFIHKFPRLVQGGFMQNWRHLSEEVLQDPTRANKEGQFLIKVYSSSLYSFSLPFMY